MLFTKIISPLSKSGVNSYLDIEDQARVTMINLSSLTFIGIVTVSAPLFFWLGFTGFWTTLFVIPLLLGVLYLHRKQNYQMARMVFVFGLLSFCFVLAILYRKIGMEYGLIALSGSSIFVVKEKKWMISAFALGAFYFLGTVGFDMIYSFEENPKINYSVVSKSYLIMGITIIFFQMIIYRTIVHEYAGYYKEGNEKLNLANEELNAINESLDAMIKERTHALEDKTEELEAQKEKLNDLVIELDRKNGQLNDTISTLKQRNFEMDQIIYRLSHNLKAPLCSIAGLCNLIKTDMNLELINLALPKIDAKINEMESVFRSVTSLTTINNEDITPEVITFDTLVSDVVNKLRIMNGASQLDIQVQKTDRKIYADRKMLALVFHHVIKNAIMFRSHFRKSTLDISFEDKGTSWKVLFKDNGMGISPQVKERMFEIFFRGTETSRGAGLGLYIAREVIRRMQGDIQIMSDETGTTVSITVPFKQEKEDTSNGVYYPIMQKVV